MKKLEFVVNPWDYSPFLNEIRETLHNVQILQEQKMCMVSVFQPAGVFKDFKDSYVRDKHRKKNFKESFFEDYSAVVIFSNRKLKEPIFVFKKLGRAPGELLISLEAGERHAFYSSKCYWKNKCYEEGFPKVLFKYFPLANTISFWRELDRFQDVEEIPIKLIRDDSIKTRNIILVRELLRTNDLIPDGRGKNKIKNDKFRALVISIYERLYKDEPKYQNRFPVNKIQAELSKQISEAKKELPTTQSIRRWINESKQEKKKAKEVKTYFQQQKHFRSDLRKSLEINGIDISSLIKSRKEERKLLNPD